MEITNPNIQPEQEITINGVGVNTENIRNIDELINAKNSIENGYSSDAEQRQIAKSLMNSGIDVETAQKIMDNISYQTAYDMLDKDARAERILAKQERDEQWAREDAIRKETQEREDSAYQRAVEDMKKAGMNPAAVSNISGASSGGGITSATGTDYESYLTRIKANYEKDKNTQNNVTKALLEFAAILIMLMK